MMSSSKRLKVENHRKIDVLGGYLCVIENFITLRIVVSFLNIPEICRGICKVNKTIYDTIKKNDSFKSEILANIKFDYGDLDRFFIEQAMDFYFHNQDNFYVINFFYSLQGKDNIFSLYRYYISNGTFDKVDDLRFSMYNYRLLPSCYRCFFYNFFFSFLFS